MLPLIGRILLAHIFVLAGVNKLFSVGQTQHYMALFNMPPILIWPTILLEIGCGVALILGWYTRTNALLLAIFTLVAGIIFHYQPGNDIQMILLMKNICIVGGLILLLQTGAGDYSLDNRLPADLR
ncbi:MAG TPA: DoxX family protein [Gammaproteobacteria bacterium]|nr:DoxX family protein [Gammaproteobacteria bacterium]